MADNTNNIEPAPNGASGMETPDSETKPANGTQVFSIPSTREIVELETDTLRHLHKLVYVFERMQLSDYISILQNPRRLIMMNFFAGVARGFGVIIGMTVLMALFLYILGRLVDAPLVGKYAAKFIHIVQTELKNTGRKF